MLLQCVPSKRNIRLLRLFGKDPWVHGWQNLCQRPCLYIIFPFPLRMSPHGPAFYVGETVHFRRRMVEHILRIAAPDGATQQPFYQVVRHGCDSGTQLFAALSFLLMLPVCIASACTEERLLAESELCRELGTLNPPLVYSFLPKRKKRCLPGMRIFDSSRPLCRRRVSSPQLVSESSVSKPCLGLLRQEWRDGLKKIASALAGHKFPKARFCALAAWNLSPGAWAYVARRVDQHEEGWRRRRGLNLLRVISRKRKNLCPLLLSVVVSIPWVGSMVAQQIVRAAIRTLISDWRKNGFWVPVARHAKCFVSWSASPSLARLLSDPSLVRKALEDGVCPVCPCQTVRSKVPGWPVVTFDGCEHIAAPQGSVPWPETLQHLARWPATLCLPPCFEDVVAAVRTSFRRLRDRCRIPIQLMQLSFVLLDSGTCLFMTSGCRSRGSK